MDDLTKRPLSRRDALKALAGITGAVAISSLPNKWSTPLVDVGALPAFAQCSPTGATAAFQFYNATEGVALVEVYDGESAGGEMKDVKSVQIGPFDYGCIEGINPGPCEFCIEITGGQCPGRSCREGNFVAGHLYFWTIFCGDLVDGPSIKED